MGRKAGVLELIIYSIPRRSGCLNLGYEIQENLELVGDLGATKLGQHQGAAQLSRPDLQGQSEGVRRGINFLS